MWICEWDSAHFCVRNWQFAHMRDKKPNNMSTRHFTRINDTSPVSMTTRQFTHISAKKNQQHQLPAIHSHQWYETQKHELFFHFVNSSEYPKTVCLAHEVKCSEHKIAALMQTAVTIKNIQLTDKLLLIKKKPFSSSSPGCEIFLQ